MSGRQIGYYDNLGKKIGEIYGKKKRSQRRPQIDELSVKGSTANDISSPGQVNTSLPDNVKIAQQATDTEVKIKKTALQQIEDYAKQNGQKIATDELNTLSNSIKQQAAAKIAALESQKNAELNNANLTSSQKQIIEAKYKKREDQVKAKAFKEEQEISIAQALINGAVAVTKVSSQEGALAPFHIGLIIAETAAQVAKIASQKPPAYATGGLHYTSDGKGGDRRAHV